MIVPPDGAFSVNCLGLDSAPFPLSFSARDTGGCWVVDATAAQAVELADLIAGPVTVLGLATNSFLDDDYRQWSSSRIADHQGVGHSAYDLSALVAGVVGLSDEVLVMRGEDLPAFLAGWSPYELTIVGTESPPDAERVEEIALAVGTAAPGGPMLPGLDGCRFWYSGHDDCYAWLESRDPALPAAVLGRLLALLVGSELADSGPVDVPEPPGPMIGALLAESPHWVGLLTPGAAAVELSATGERWRLGSPRPEKVDRTLTYDAPRRAWLSLS